jgi:hypothetical protein
MGNKIGRKSAPVGIRTSNLLIRSQMLYPVELRAPFEEQLICEGRARRSNSAKKVENFSGRWQDQKRFADAGLWNRSREIVRPTIHSPAPL